MFKGTLYLREFLCDMNMDSKGLSIDLKSIEHISWKHINSLQGGPKSTESNEESTRIVFVDWK